jgi:hypothetical protein
MAVLNSIITELEAYKAQDPGIPGLITELTALQAEFDALPSVKQLNENPDMDFSEVKPAKGEMDPLIKKIAEIRATIIKG